MTVGERIEKFTNSMPFNFKATIPCDVDYIIDRLQAEGFFTAPASANHHGNYEGGLFDHSFEVAKALVQLTERNHLLWTIPRSPWVVGMFHDICKIDCYKPAIYGEGYEYTDDTLYKGHGDKSVMLLSSYFELTPEEAASIRYHMGAFTDKDEWKYYTRAVKRFPNVLWTHHADMIASQIKGV